MVLKTVLCGLYYFRNARSIEYRQRSIGQASASVPDLVQLPLELVRRFDKWIQTESDLIDVAQRL